MLLEYLAGLIELIFNSLTFFKDDGSDAGKVAFLIPATVKIIFAGFKLLLYGFRVKDGHVDTLSMISISEANAITTYFFVLGQSEFLALYLISTCWPQWVKFYVLFG